MRKAMTTPTTMTLFNETPSFVKNNATAKHHGLLVLAVTIVLSLITVFTFLGNSLILYTFYKQPSLRRICYYPIISLAIADVLCATFSMPAYIAKKHVPESGTGDWPEVVTCDLFRFTYFLTAYASVLSLTVISIERLIVINTADKPDVWLTRKKVLLALVISWLDAALVSILPFFWQRDDSNLECTYSPTKVWSMMVIITNVLVPFLVMTACHIRIVYFAIRYNRQKGKARWMVHKLRCELLPAELGRTIDEDTVIKQKREFIKRERRITCIFFIVVAVYVVCWAPSSFYYFIKMVCPQCLHPAFVENQQIVKAVVKLLTFLNSALNPLICMLLHRPFKKSFCQTIFWSRRI